MNDSVRQLLDRYNLNTVDDYRNAVREIIQQIALQGLYKAGFFEQAAFYGGTALRLVYGLDRSSEDLDFSLLESNPNFRLSTFSDALTDELDRYGFHVTFNSRDTISSGNIDSAFLKENTRLALLSLDIEESELEDIKPNQNIKIKLEIDIEPPAGFETEIKTFELPETHSIRTYCLPDLLAGKLHAVLCRGWQNRLKGRDWYDMAWYVNKGYTTVNIQHLENRMRQSNHYSAPEHLTIEKLKKLLYTRIESSFNLKQLVDDTTPFIVDDACLNSWCVDYFHSIVDKLID